MLQIWENYVEGEEVPNGASVESEQKEVLKVLIMQLYLVVLCEYAVNWLKDVLYFIFRL